MAISRFYPAFVWSDADQLRIFFVDRNRGIPGRPGLFGGRQCRASEKYDLITLITPIVEVDGWDRQTDICRWHLAHPEDNWPPLLYRGKYVAHDFGNLDTGRKLDEK